MSDSEEDNFATNPVLPKTIEEMFHEAAFHGRIEDVRRYLKKGVEVDWRDSNGWTALMLACRQKETEISKLLISQGADVKAVGMNMWTPLHYACHSDDQEIIKLLLEKGADKMALTVDGKTPRDYCVKWAMKKHLYSRPEYEIEYERWLYPEIYEEECRQKEEAEKKQWEQIKSRMEQRKQEENQEAKQIESEKMD